MKSSRLCSTAASRLRRAMAFTLLEVVLTLSMAVVLMSLVGATLQFYATNMSVRDTDVRRVHLASSILQMIGDDLRASLYGSTFDASALETLLTSSTSGQGGGGAATTGAATSTSATGTTATSDATSTDETDSDSSDLSTSTTTMTKPGMIGNQTQLQFDVSRLPRLERWTKTQVTSPTKLTDIPSDTKTVTYYVQAAGSISGVIDPVQSYLPSSNATTVPMTSGGLVRRELDRAASSFAMSSGGIARLLTTGDLVATEVTAIGFEYYDGSIWQATWNSDSSSAMPKAVRITMTMSDTTAVTDLTSLTTGIATGSRTFRHTVLLPVGMVAKKATTATAESTDTTTSTTGATGTSTTATTGGTQ